MKAIEFIPKPGRHTEVVVCGHPFQIAFDEEGPEEAEQHHFFGNTPARGRYRIAQWVKLGDKWHDVIDVFSSDFNDEIDASLNGAVL